MFTQLWKLVGTSRNRQPAAKKKAKRIVNELVELYFLHGVQFDPRGLADMAKSLSAVEWTPTDEWINVTKPHVLRQIEYFSAYNCALIMQGLCTMDINDVLLLNSILDRYCVVWESGIPTDLAMIIQAIQRVNFQMMFDQESVLKLAVKTFLPDMQPAELARVSIFCVQLFPEESFIHQSLLERIVNAGPYVYGPQEICSTLQTFAKLNTLDEPFILSIVNLSLEKVGEFSGRQAAYTTYALGELCRLRQMEFMDSVQFLLRQFTPLILKEVHLLDNHVIALVMKGYAILRVFDVELFKKLTPRIDVTKLYTAQLVNVLWAFSIIIPRIRGSFYHELMDNTIKQFKNRFSSLTNSQIVSCIWSLSKLHYRIPKLLHLSAQSVLEHENAFSLVMTITLLNAYAQVNFKNEQFSTLVAKKLVQSKRPTTRDVCNVMTDLLILDSQPLYVDMQDDRFSSISSASGASKVPLFAVFVKWINQAPSLSNEDLRQIYECYIMSKQQNDNSITPHFNWWKELKQQIQDESLKKYEEYLQRLLEERKAFRQSKFSLEVMSILERGVIQNKCGFNQLVKGQYICDLVIYAENEVLVIEVDGPQKFCVQEPYFETGSTIVRNKVAQKLGIPFVSIPFYDWLKLDTVEQKKEYLRKLLLKFQ